MNRWRRFIDWQTARAAERFEVLPAGRNHRIVYRKRCGCDRHRSPVERLGIVKPPCLLGDDGEVVQCIGEVRVERAQFGFLNTCGASEELIGRREIVRRGRVFRGVEQASRFL